jgi:hypothetical protein
LAAEQTEVQIKNMSPEVISLSKLELLLLIISRTLEIDMNIDVTSTSAAPFKLFENDKSIHVVSYFSTLALTLNVLEEPLLQKGMPLNVPCCKRPRGSTEGFTGKTIQIEHFQ